LAAGLLDGTGPSRGALESPGNLQSSGLGQQAVAAIALAN
jgi:hypothetical protein